MLSTNPDPSGSMTCVNTIGVVGAACSIGASTTLLDTRITSGASAATSAAMGTGSVERAPTIFDANIAPDGPARGLQRLLKRGTAGNRFRIVLGESNDDADPPYALTLLR